MIRRLTRGAALAVAVGTAMIVGLAGCGVPSETDVVVEGPGQEVAPTQGDEGTSEPPGRTATTDPQEFTRNFLMAAAGAPDRAADRVREFISPEVDDWKPAVPALHIVRLRGDPLVSDVKDGGFEAQVTVTHVGVLGQNGVVVPDPAQRIQNYRFRIADVGQGGLYVTTPPNVILLADNALTLYYEPRTLYFWSVDSKTLVPDLRYLPRRDVPTAQQPNQIIDWLLDGPAAWLEDAVLAPPPDARRVANVPAVDDNRLEVTLSKAADTEDEAAVDRLATQLRWSLRPATGGDRELSLRIDQVREVYTDRGYLDANPAYRGGSDPMRLCLFDKIVRRLLPVPEGARATPRLPAGYRALPLRVAMGRDGDRTAVAVVRAGPGGRQVLDLGVGDDATLGPPMPSSLVTRGEIGQPAWLPGSPALGLVVADGQLFTFRAGGTAVSPLSGARTGVTAFAVPPDGRRLAYIVGGRLFVAPLVRDDNTLRVGEEQQQVPTGLTGLAGVGWSQQASLVVAGQDGGRLQFRDVTVDGAVQESRLGQFGSGPVTHLVAAADDPSDGPGQGAVMYEANGVTYELFSQQRRLTSADVEGVAAGAPDGAKPTSPFFLD